MNKKVFYFYGVLSLVSFVASLLYIFTLPQTVPVHWNAQGIVDRYGSKYQLLIIALGPIFFFLMFLFIHRFWVTKNKKSEKAYLFIFSFLVIFMIVVAWLILLLAGGAKFPVVQILMAGVGILLIVLGNYLPVVPQNAVFGIRTPWTLKNEVVWKKTQRMSGFFFIAAGLVIVVLVLLQVEFVTEILIGIMVVYLVLSMVYSYNCYKKIVDEKE